jgi:3-hydroxyisobutyrate dehydrogenase
MTIEQTVFSPASTRIGWVGTGVMGLPMCAHLIEAGCRVTVFNRTKARAAELLDKGALWAGSPGEVALASDVVFTIVGFPRDVREVYFGEHGVLAGLSRNMVCVDMTTTSPSLAVEIAGAARDKEALALDAPVSGGDVGARNAALSIMAGGEESAFQAVLPLFRIMGENILYQGPEGSGQHTKMCNQIIIAGTMIGVCESLVYAASAGLDPEKMLGSVTRGAASCWSLENLAPRVLKNDYSPGFMIDHFIKDMGIALEETRRMGIHLPGLELAEKLYARASALGHGRDGTQALYQALLSLKDRTSPH